MASSFVGVQVNSGACGCTEIQILQIINRNLIAGIAAIAGGGAVQAGVEALAAADTSKAIVFPTAFAAAPAPQAILVSPTGGTSIAARIDLSTLTANGMTVRFSAIPASGWVLSWIAAEES